jgi:pimeloyl-ACP methyl ester carboxylesterase
MRSPPGLPRSLARGMAHHAAWLLRGAAAPWAAAMLSELDHIDDDRAALRWAWGCLWAGYAARLAARPAWLNGVAAGCLLAVVGALALQGPAISAPTFDETACDLPDVAPALRPRLRCGTVAVPRDHDDPTAGSFKLAVVIVGTTAKDRQPDPVLFLHGGPGSPLTGRTGRIAQRESAVLAPDRDLILVDQRGSGRSEPALCPELPAQQLQLIARNPEPAAFDRAWGQGYRDCRRALAQAGLDPAWFGTVATSEDLDIVRQALGVARWNVYGRSYGTTVGLAMMARHPDSLRAVVLDSVYPPDPLPRSYGETANAALDATFAACGADPACVAAHPDLSATFDGAMAALERDPLTIPMGPEKFVLGPRGFAVIVEQMLYYPPLLAQLPRMIQAVHDRDADSLRPVIEHLAAGFLDGSRGNQVAVHCRDRPGPHATTRRGRIGLFDPQDAVCRDWAVSPAPPPIAASAVPSLLLAGGRDPITPPALARYAAGMLGPSARVVEFPTLAHDIGEFSPCGAGLITRFVRDPRATLDTTCAAAVPPVKFR